MHKNTQQCTTMHNNAQQYSGILRNIQKYSLRTTQKFSIFQHLWIIKFCITRKTPGFARLLLAIAVSVRWGPRLFLRYSFCLDFTDNFVVVLGLCSGATCWRSHVSCARAHNGSFQMWRASVSSSSCCNSGPDFFVQNAPIFCKYLIFYCKS